MPKKKNMGNPLWAGHNNHRRVHGGTSQSLKRLNMLIKRSDELGIPMFMMSDDDWDECFTAIGVRNHHHPQAY